jgi:DnaK suppressor protein
MSHHIEDYKRLLQNKLVELGSTTRKPDLAIVETADPVDQTTNAAERDISAELINRNSQLRREIERAFQRLREGTFGECEDCGEQVSERRLNALPWARLCIHCQEALDGQASHAISTFLPYAA